MADFPQLVSIIVLSVIFFCITPLCVFAQVSNNSTQSDNLQPDDKLLLDKTIITLLQEERSNSEGTVLIASATVFAFVSFGSFLALKFESNSARKYLLDFTGYIMICVFVIEVCQTYIMISVVKSWFVPTVYEILMVISVICVGTILLLIRLMLGLQNPEREKQITKITDEFLDLFTKNLHSDSANE